MITPQRVGFALLAVLFALFVVKVAIPFTRGYLAGARPEWRKVRGGNR